VAIVSALSAIALQWPSSPRGPGSHDGSDGLTETRPGSPPAPRYPWLSAIALLTLALALPASTGAQSVPPFVGRYRFFFTAGASCPAAKQVGPLSILMDVTEATVSAGAEVSGVPASASETPANGRFVFLRQGTRLHGASASAGPQLGLDTEGLYRLWMHLVADGTATIASGGRARASGTAFGGIEISLASDSTGTPIDGGECDFALDHQWSLEPA
jgi:hypothetical protein